MRIRLLVLLLLSLTFVLSAEAGAKGPTSAEVCGENECREIASIPPSRHLTTPVFAAQGRPDTPPTTSSGWFDITMHFGDFPERFALLRDPAYIRAIGRREGIVSRGEVDGRYGWLKLSPAETAAHETLTRGLDPLPIAELPRLQATAPGLAAATRAAAEENGISAKWFAIGAAGALLACAALLLRRRRTPPNLKPAT